MALNAKHLLIVEDNRSLRQMLTWEFEDLGYRVSTAGCCSSAASVCVPENERFDFALLDYNLPDGCGTELVDRLRADNPNIEIVICSGRSSGQDISCQRCHFVPKPVTAQQLHRLFQRLIDSACA